MRKGANRLVRTLACQLYWPSSVFRQNMMLVQK
jgi:hypothetical protein